MSKSKNGTALITGASSGIGLEIARILAGRGYDLVLTSNEGPELKRISSDFKKELGIKIYTKALDLAKPDAAEKLHKYCRSQKVKIDVLVNNAGTCIFGEAVDLPEKKQRELVTLNALTLTSMCVLFGADMKKRKRGHILNIASISGHTPLPFVSVYSASKTYVRSFSTSLRCELHNYGVKVTSVSPGATRTNLYKNTNVDVNLAGRAGVMMKPDKVARKAVKAMFKGKGDVIIGLSNVFLVYLTMLVPMFVFRVVRRFTKY